MIKRPIIFPTDTLWHKIFARVYFCGLAIFCVLRELIFAIRSTDCWFFLLGINFYDFRKYTQYPALIIFSFLLSTCNRNTYFQTILNFCGKNFAVIFICGNLFLRIAEKMAKIRTHKISCHKVKVYALLDFTKCIRNNFRLKVLLFSASTDSHEILPIKMTRRQRGKNNNRSVPWV